MIPTIDLSKRLTDDASADDSSRRILEACSETGGFYVVGHGVGPEIVGACLDAARSLHSLPASRRLALQARHFGGARGYIPSDLMDDDPDREQYSLSTTAQSRRRRYEAFDVGRAAVSRESPSLAATILNENPWPELLGFRESVDAYFDAMVALARGLAASLGQALGLEEDFFPSRTEQPCCTLRLMHYPSGPSEPIEGIHPHTDFELLSILTGTAGGLQILSRAGQWLDVEQPPGSLLVILGDMAEVLTCGKIESTLHRVVMSGNERHSLSFFFGLDYDVVVEPIKTLVGTDADLPYQSVHAGRHLSAMSVRTFRHLRRRLANGEVSLDVSVPEENPFIARKLKRIVPTAKETDTAIRA